MSVNVAGGRCISPIADTRIHANNADAGRSTFSEQSALGRCVDPFASQVQHAGYNHMYTYKLGGHVRR